MPCHLYGLVMYFDGYATLTVDDFGNLLPLSNEAIDFHCDNNCWSMQ